MIEHYGYKGEKHTVITSDGYVIEMHRIIGPNNTHSDPAKKPPVFLMHGILCSSMDWVIAGERSLGRHF